MISVVDPSRREWLKLGLAAALPAGAAASPSEPLARSRGRAKAVIVVGLWGGPPQHETFDPKPDAPPEIRGPFGSVASRTPGLRVGELMPMTARVTDKLAVLRAVVTNDNAHSSSGYQMLTGVPHEPPSVENVVARAPNLWPSFAAVVRHLDRRDGKLPASAVLPDHLWNDGNIPWPGQDGGFLGAAAHPWLLHCDPAKAGFKIDALELPSGVDFGRFLDRRRLLELADRASRSWGDLPALATREPSLRQAADLIAAPQARRAFDLGREPQAVRDRFGPSRFGQSLLLARRLVEAGVTLVQVNWTRIEGVLNSATWDSHSKHAETCKVSMPVMDRCYSALIEDLDARGMLDSTLVVWVGEFGRTPKFNAQGGRDHWGGCFSAALAGGGVRGGVVHGASDAQAARPTGGAVAPCDLWATALHLLGHRPDAEIRDAQGRPVPASRGEPIAAVL
jgi:hypothetical protein